MSARARADRIAVDESAGDNEAKKKHRRIHVAPALTTRWGWKDADWYFRWSAADLGFKAQAIEPQAETVYDGRKWVALWDFEEEAKTNYPAVRDIMGQLRGRVSAAKAMPRHESGDRSSGGGDRRSDRKSTATRRYERVETGMGALRVTDPKGYAILCVAFLPKRTDPEIESVFGQLADLCLRIDRTHRSHALASERAKEPVSVETWLLGAIRRREDVIGLIRGDGEALVDVALTVYEGATVPPPRKEQHREPRDHSGDFGGAL